MLTTHYWLLLSIRRDGVARFGGFVGRQRPAGRLLAFEAERPVGLHECVYVARALIDDCGLAVAQIALDGIVVRVAVRAVNFNCHRRGLLAADGRLPLRQRGRARVRAPLILEPAGLEPEQVRHLVVGFHVGNLLLDELMVGYLRPERLALQSIRHGRVARGTDDAGRARRHRVAPLLQSEHRYLEALALLANHVLGRHAHVLQREVAGVARADAELAVDGARSEAGHRAFDDEAGHATVVALATLLFIRPAEEEEVVGHIGERNPHLLAVQDPLVALAPRGRARADPVPPRAPVAPTAGRELFALRLRYEVLALLLLCAPRVERQRVESRVDAHHDAQGRIHRFQLLADEAERDVVEARPAVLFGDADAEQAKLGHLVEHGAVELLLLVPLLDVRRHLALRELAHGLDERPVFFGQLKVDHGCLFLK